MIESINAILDRLPGTEFRLGERAIPTFFVCGVAGLATGTFVLVTLSAIKGADIAVALGLVPIALFVSIALALVRKRRAGFERWVLLEHLLVDLAGIGAALRMVHQPLAPWLDLIFPGFCVLFAFGRLGCASAGCCVGHRADVGIDFERGAAASHRRFPVQLLESGVWLGCAALGAILTLCSAPGLAFGTTALLYAIARFFLESMRADPRPALLGLSESRWLSLVLAMVALAVLKQSGHLSAAGIRLGAIGLVLTAALWIGSPSWLASSKDDERVLLKLTEHGRALAEGSPHRTVQVREFGRFTVASSWNEAEGPELFVSVLARDGSRLSPVWARLAFESLSRGLGLEGVVTELVESSPGRFSTRFAQRLTTTASNVSLLDEPTMPQTWAVAANNAPEVAAVRSEYFGCCTRSEPDS